MKWTGGPVVAKATVSGFRQLPDTTSEELRQAVAGFALHELEAYWRSLPPRFDGLALYLTEEAWLDEPLIVSGRSRGASWLVFSNAAERREWMATAPASRDRPERDPRGPRTAAPALRFAVFRRDSFTCQYCGRTAPHVALHIDHVAPWADGGRTELANLRTACDVCNLGKGRTNADHAGTA